MLSFAIDKVFQKVNGALHHFYKHRKNCNAALYKWPEKSSLNVDHVLLSVLTDLGLSPKKVVFTPSLFIVINMPRETQLQMITQNLTGITHQLVDPSARMESRAPRG